MSAGIPVFPRRRPVNSWTVPKGSGHQFESSLFLNTGWPPQGGIYSPMARQRQANLQDLKAGYLVGATPWRQQVMLAIGALSCALVMAPVLNLLLKAYGIGVPAPDHPNPLLAPQATLMASASKVFSADNCPGE
jgi:hypothetical protein